ncbi:MAG TPA: DUF202 domain-containing protein [Cellulomonas sp.]
MSGVQAPPGVQPERTALAWQRTGLALVVGSLGGARLLEPATGPAVWLLAVAGALAAGLLIRAGRRRARRWQAVLDAGHRVPAGVSVAHGPGGLLLIGTAVGVLLLGATALVLVLVA